jgi:hypothetical protein
MLLWGKSLLHKRKWEAKGLKKVKDVAISIYGAKGKNYGSFTS